jgi:hypothetical protein
MAELAGDIWAHCSACRKGIAFSKIHWVCSVSTCNRARTQLVFCSVSCWDSHVATLRHRDSWAVEARAPSRGAAAAGQGSTVNDYPEPAAPTGPRSEAPTQPLGRPGMVGGGSGGATLASSGGGASGIASPPRRIVSPVGPAAPVASGAPASSFQAMPGAAPALSSTFDRDVLIVVSKMKKYIKDRSGMNTSDAVAEDLSEHVRAICDDAIRAAAADGRKTVLERDVPRPRR